MTVVLDSGGITALAGSRERLRQLRDRGEWPPIVPTVVLVESLTGDHRRDFAVNRLVAMCLLAPLDELTARSAAALRAKSARKVSAADAVVVATADRSGGSVVLTGDPKDLNALAAGTQHEVRIARP